jgi:hypothetical protein
MPRRTGNRLEEKAIKKDQTVKREVLEDLEEATDRPEVGNAGPQYQHPNRDQSRGDWDRSRRHTDEKP